jgi:hypothetical protein
MNGEQKQRNPKYVTRPALGDAITTPIIQSLEMCSMQPLRDCMRRFVFWRELVLALGHNLALRTCTSDGTSRSSMNMIKKSLRFGGRINMEVD